MVSKVLLSNINNIAAINRIIKQLKRSIHIVSLHTLLGTMDATPTNKIGINKISFISSSTYDIVFPIEISIRSR